MKLTKIFAGMAAAAIATTAMAVTAFAADSTAYNYLFIATDIPCEYNDNDEALVNGQVVTCKDLKVKIGSQEFNVSAAPGKTDSDKLCFQIINKWNSKFTSLLTSQLKVLVTQQAMLVYLSKLTALGISEIQMTKKRIRLHSQLTSLTSA